MDGKADALTWEAASAEILNGMREWRMHHPKATLREIEAALDEHWYRLRARMLHDLALQSAARRLEADPTLRSTSLSRVWHKAHPARETSASAHNARRSAPCVTP